MHSRVPFQDTTVCSVLFLSPIPCVQVNTGNYRRAVDLFRALLAIRPGLVGAHLGLGSALAFLGGMDSAVASFSAAIEVTIPGLEQDQSLTTLKSALDFNHRVRSGEEAFG